MLDLADKDFKEIVMLKKKQPKGNHAWRIKGKYDDSDCDG
jgi:hypothetical protein